MGFVNKLFGAYEPQGAFSFEFLNRSDDGSLGNQLYESFFLLPPEDYSIEEGFKMTVNKTLNGGWIDDFGNDFKKIRLSGSIHSFYFGSPNKASGNILKDFGKSLADNFTAGITGIAGIDEFFKLRWLVSHIRDPKAVFSQETIKLLKRFPEIAFLESKLTANNAINNIPLTYKNYGVVYHDYDDNNHYEVVFDSFIASRSKEDPFTVMYTIEMTGLRPVSSNPRFFGVNLKAFKETYTQIINSSNASLLLIRSEMRDLLSVATSIALVPANFIYSFMSLISAFDGIGQELEDFINGIQSSYETLIATINGVDEQCDEAIEELINGNTETPKEDVDDDTANIDDAVLDIYSLIEKAREQLLILQGLISYIDTTTKQKVILDEDPNLDTSDFPIEAATQGENTVTELRYIYYTVKQFDTLQSISKYIFGNYLYADIIGQVNNLQNSDFDDNGLLGKTIKIPLFNQGGQSTAITTNLVYARISELMSPKERQLKTLGVDIRLDVDRDFVADSVKDISVNYGEDAFLDNINDRLSFSQNSLNELHEEWGVSFGAGEIPLQLIVQKIIDVVQTQIGLDPRTKVGYVDVDAIDIINGKLYVPLILQPLTGSENIIDIGSIVSGQLNQGV